MGEFNGIVNEAGGPEVLPIITHEGEVVGSMLLCSCGCGMPAQENSKYYDSTCRPRAYRLRHPTVDLSGLDAKAAKRAERMISDVVEAAKHGLVRATIDARHPVKHEKDERPSCRVRLTAIEWEMLTEIFEHRKELGPPYDLSRSGLVGRLILREWESMQKRRAS